ncbi:uncharacterized protein LOC134741192 [Cydia strobilella]|uniref:uncharacterized protein LOC134741192 n=1 Tax=Cydia strobilella TaxID=1100964 RepID=UPI003004D31E
MPQPHIPGVPPGVPGNKHHASRSSPPSSSTRSTSTTTSCGNPSNLTTCRSHIYRGCLLVCQVCRGRRCRHTCSSCTTSRPPGRSILPDRHRNLGAETAGALLIRFYYRLIVNPVPVFIFKHVNRKIAFRAFAHCLYLKGLG